MNSRKLIARLMELILLLSVLLALIGALMMALGGGFADMPIDLFPQTAAIAPNNGLFFGMAVLVLLSAPLVIAFAAAIDFWRQRKRGMMLAALLLLVILAVSICNV
ncbi:MAG: hypothetical protein LBV04_06495 [Deferribacteraceae bacterium]|jgi:hypothetical protein|nr:hypothetical protein [Deferribacteraceae bacterium]